MQQYPVIYQCRRAWHPTEIPAAGRRGPRSSRLGWARVGPERDLAPSRRYPHRHAQREIPLSHIVQIPQTESSRPWTWSLPARRRPGPIRPAPPRSSRIGHRPVGQAAHELSSATLPRVSSASTNKAPALGEEQLDRLVQVAGREVRIEARSAGHHVENSADGSIEADPAEAAEDHQDHRQPDRPDQVETKGFAGEAARLAVVEQAPGPAPPSYPPSSPGQPSDRRTRRRSSPRHRPPTIPITTEGNRSMTLAEGFPADSCAPRSAASGVRSPSYDDAVAEVARGSPTGALAGRWPPGTSTAAWFLAGRRSGTPGLPVADLVGIRG